MSQPAQERSRNAHYAIAVKQNKPPQTSNMRQSRTPPTNKQPSGHTAMRSAKRHTRNKVRNTHTPPHAIRKARRAQTSAHAVPANSATQTQGNPRSRTNQAQPQGHPDTAYATNATTPGNHTPHGGAFPSRAQCANHGPATGEREPPEHTPTGARPPRRRGEPPEHGRDKEKIRVPAQVSQARREHPADNTRDSSGQQRNRTSPEQFERAA